MQILKQKVALPPDLRAVAAMIFIAYKALLASRARKHVGSLGARSISYAPNPPRRNAARFMFAGSALSGLLGVL